MLKVYTIGTLVHRSSVKFLYIRVIPQEIVRLVVFRQATSATYVSTVDLICPMRSLQIHFSAQYFWIPLGSVILNSAICAKKFNSSSDFLNFWGRARGPGDS